MRNQGGMVVCELPLVLATKGLSENNYDKKGEPVVDWEA